MKEFILHINPKKPENAAHAKDVIDRLEKNGAQVILSDETAEMLKLGEKYSVVQISRDLTEGKILIIMGGDGTILKFSKYAARSGVPILGINTGNLGFLSEIETNEMDLIDKAVSGDYRIEERMMLDVLLERGGQTVLSDQALNEVILTKAKIGNVVDIYIKSDGLQIIKYSGDGVIFSTPTGSTAYSMSAGGPIVEPCTKNTVITPICAHELHAHSFVMSSERRFEASVVCGENRKAYISVDGNKEIDVLNGETVKISRSKFVTSLIRVNQRSFNDRINLKFSKR